MGQTDRFVRSQDRRMPQERPAPAFIPPIRDEDGPDGAPLHEKLYQRVRGQILSGALQHGSRLAPSRSLARLLGISRNSVMTALDRLIADGLLESRHGSGVYVRYTGTTAAPVSKPDAGSQEPRPFQLGVPPIDIFPALLWRRLQSRRWRHISPALLRDDNPAGWIGLREAIASYVAMTRGLECSPGQVVVTNCIAAGLDLAARALGLSGSEVWMENPGSIAGAQALQNGGTHLVPVPVDVSGIDVEAGRKLAPRARAAYVTAACQFPTAVTMPSARRRALAAWIRERNTWLLEDDFDWNNGSADPLPKPLAGLIPDRTIYFNTFNHILFPTLRIGYLIAPPALVDRFIAVQSGVYGSSNIPNQMVMADFINGGHLDDHMKRLKDCHSERRAALLQAIETELADFLVPLPARAGSHIICKTRNLSAAEIVSIAAANGISISPMEKYRAVAGDADFVLLGYAGFSPRVIAEAASRLRSALKYPTV
jgi:GntR family transcriptional regulator/MocR family aminotransferase